MLSKYLNNLIKVLAIGAGFASIPLFAALAELQPPWPPAVGFVSAALVLLGSLVVWEWTRNAKVANRRRWIARATAVTILSLFLYLGLFSTFTYPLEGRPRTIIGFECKSEPLRVYKVSCAELEGAILEGGGGNPNTFWTARSITAVRLALNAAWLGFTAGLIMAVGAIVAGRRF